ncbi:MAG: LptF/LptG family permease [Alkalispirochaeta sp.]
MVRTDRTAPTRIMNPLMFRYVGGEFLLSFLVAFAFFFFMFFINQLLLLAEDILQKDVPFSAVVRLIVYSVPSIIALSVPFATLVGSLMAVGRLSGDNEIVAFRAAGFPLTRLFSPVLVLAVLLSITSFLINDVLLPLGTLNFGRLYRELLYANPALELEPYTVKRYQEDTLITGAVGPGQVDQFVIIDTDAQGNRRLITAERAELLQEGDPNTIGLSLSGVTSISAVSKNDYNYSMAGTMRYNILLQDITVAIRSPGPREMSARDVLEEIRYKEEALSLRTSEWRGELALRKAESQTAWMDYLRGSLDIDVPQRISQDTVRITKQKPFDRSLQVHRLEYHKKYSIPFAAVSFVFLAFPLGLYSRRSGRGVGFGTGLLVATVYWALLIGGQTFGTQRANVPPFLAMWLPNILFLVVGITVFFRRSHR